ncbi:MAG TPA: hypothetical protein VHK91_13945 [Flavisolibacter sp.]|jgi:hypothetical protein|nr:hypothetical protein [Flavisolibacter sp.]
MVSNDPGRNRPSDKGTQNDPFIRDESAHQPGVNTMSSSDTDDLNNDLTETAGDDFRENKNDSKADADFEDIDRNDP